MPLPKHAVVSSEEIESRYEISSDVDYPFADFADEQEQRLYRGGLRVDGDFASEDGVDWNPYNVVVDGDLIVDGTIDWSDYGSGCFVLVTGNVRCKNLLLQGCPTFVIRGDLVVDGGIQGHHGDDGGYLKVRGKTTAKVIVNTLYFNMELGTPPEAIVCSDEHYIDCPVDFNDEELGDVLLPDLLDDSGIDEHAVGKALREGREVLRPGVRPSHLAALDAIETLISKGDPVSELDLAEKKLRGFPVRLLELRGLKRLVLRGNTLGEVPPEIAKLTELEELDVAECGLEALPDTLSQLANLRQLDISGNPFDAIPTAIARLPALRVLHADMLAGTDLDPLGDAHGLEELSLSFLTPEDEEDVDDGDEEQDDDGDEEQDDDGDEERDDDGDEEQDDDGAKLIPFPRPILRLTKLRVLNLSSAALSDVPDEITTLTALEELDLGGAVGRLERLPPLHRLPRLRVLRISGGAANTGAYARHALLDGVWSIETLEHLAIDRYGEEESANRPPLTSLPDDAFSKMPNLRVLDLSFNELTRLPESFYALTKLESVDLQYTQLDKPTLERLRTTFPRVKLDLRNVETRFDVDDPNWKAVHEGVERASKKASRNRAAAVAGFEAALALCTPGSCYSDYDELYALYGIVDAMGHLHAAAKGAERERLRDKIAEYATKALERVPAPGTIWHFTDEGAFQEEVTRRAGNALAWMLMERGQLDRALAAAERALSVGGENGYVLDTKVRILLAAGREHDAYLIVDRVLTEDPSFGDFQDLKSSPSFVAWQAANR